MDTGYRWEPPGSAGVDRRFAREVTALFEELFPQDQYGSLAARVAPYWISRVRQVWAGKKEQLRQKDLDCRLDDPLARIQQRCVVIAYADSVRAPGEATLETLDRFLENYFPAVGGLHILPACEINTQRFNDGGFSQVRRDRVHPAYGSNRQFARMMERYYSMTDLVLNHVDIDHPLFRQYLAGDEQAGDCFYLFSEKDYNGLQRQGAFRAIFRPRPFPLFTIFRRNPAGRFAAAPYAERCAAFLQDCAGQGLAPLPDSYVDMLVLFRKVKNDQMLLEQDADLLDGFREHLGAADGHLCQQLFTVSRTQESSRTPFVFRSGITTMEDLLRAVLPAAGLAAEESTAYTDLFAAREVALFGEPVYALTTFSHVQVDLNTGTEAGMRLLVDDLCWYLEMDLNMLRLDAANFAFKLWGTSCFGLPQVTRLMAIVYRSMAYVSPRMVPNLEVNAPLSTVLAQMADKKTPPPMMYDFHLAAMLPVVFNNADARPLMAIAAIVDGYDIPAGSIRFSLDESHDGKSVSGSGGADPLLTYGQRQQLLETVTANGGYVKYKETRRYRMPAAEFVKVCREADLDRQAVEKAIFEKEQPDGGELVLQAGIRNVAELAAGLGLTPSAIAETAALSFMAEKMLDGREPYELCVSTLDSLKRLSDPSLTAQRYLASKTLALALMGRHVKAVYFNDLMALGNDPELVRTSGELRNIKRTRSELASLQARLTDPASIEYRVACGMNNLVALADADPAFHPGGAEARVVVDDGAPAVAMVHTCCEPSNTVVVVNTDSSPREAVLLPRGFGLPPARLFDNLGRQALAVDESGAIRLQLPPFGRLWLTAEAVAIERSRMK